MAITSSQGGAGCGEQEKPSATMRQRALVTVSYASRALRTLAARQRSPQQERRSQSCLPSIRHLEPLETPEAILKLTPNSNP